VIQKPKYTFGIQDYFNNTSSLWKYSYYDVIVIGAGFAGAVFAREMADFGKRVLILEKRPQICGNMYDKYEDGILVHKYGPHIFHTNNAAVFNYLKRFSSWYKYEHKVLGKIDGNYIPIPFNFASIDILFDVETSAELKKSLTEFFGKDKRISVLDLLSHEEKQINELGQLIYEKIFVNYTAKQWGIPIEKIDVSTINRVPVVTGYDDRYFCDSIQMMPKDGFYRLFEKMLQHKKIKIMLNTNAKSKLRLEFKEEKIFFENNEFKGIVFFTGAIDDFLDYKYEALPYRSLNLVFEKVDQKIYQPASVVNYPNEEEYTRITEFKHFTEQLNDKKERQNHSIILKEYPLPYEHQKVGEPYYPVINETSINLYKKYSDITNVFKNLYLCGRLAEYKYFNMDSVIERALNCAEKVKDVNGNRYILVKELFLYGIIGSCSAGLDSVIFLLLRKFNMYLYLANFISINFGILTSFMLNAFINFRTTDRLLRRAIKFFSVGYTGLLLSMFIMYLGVELLDRKELVVKITSIFIVATCQFTINKLFTFRKARNE